MEYGGCQGLRGGKIRGALFKGYKVSISKMNHLYRCVVQGRTTQYSDHT